MPTEAKLVGMIVNAARLVARVEGMKAENLDREHRGLAPAYVEDHFLLAIDEEGLDPGQVQKTLFPEIYWNK